VGTLAADGPAPGAGPDSGGGLVVKQDGAAGADAASGLEPDGPAPDARPPDVQTMSPDAAVADPRACGNMSCADGWCELPPMECGAGRSQGRCLPHRDNGVCDAVYLPVCGCDGKTYGNDCSRLLKEVSLAYVGQCKPGGGDGGSGSDRDRP
jgi:hypothetical protein